MRSAFMFVAVLAVESIAAPLTGPRVAPRPGAPTTPTAVPGTNLPTPLIAPNIPLTAPSLIGPNLAAPILPAGIKPTEGSPIAVIMNAKASAEDKAPALDNLFDKSSRADGTALEAPAAVDAPASTRLNPAPIAAAARNPAHQRVERRHGGVVHHHDLIRKEVAGAGFALIGMIAAVAPLTLAILLAIPVVMPSVYYAGGALGSHFGGKLGARNAGEVVGRVAGSLAGAAGTLALLSMAPELVVAHTLLVMGALSGSLFFEFVLKKRRAKRRP